MQAINLDQSGRDTLDGLGLTHRYPVHIDVVNNETGFALYVETPFDFDEGWEPLFLVYDTDDSGYRPVPVDSFVQGQEPVYEPEDWYDDLYLRIRELDGEGAPGTWHTIQLKPSAFAQNANPPAALGVDEFDSVTWLEGLTAGKDYHVQLWFDQNGNGQLDLHGHFERGVTTIHHRDGTVTVEPSDLYYWQPPDLYSGVHTINTESEDFNVDIDADNTMDFFASDDSDLIVGGPDQDRLIGSPHSDTIYGEGGNDLISGRRGDDNLYGGPGNDRIAGSHGNNRISGGTGDDRLSGSADADTFIFQPGHGNDTILDFNRGDDIIRLVGFTSLDSYTDLSIRQQDDDTVIDLSAHGGGTITLQDVGMADLTADDFLFA